MEAGYGRKWLLAKDALDGGAGEIEAIVTTGKLDIGRGVLAHPIALYAQGELDGAAEVAVTTTLRAMPTGPSTRSVNSRSSRPRSPTSAMTTTSASIPRANLARSEDFPTPDPANSPIRWPR